MSSSGPQAAKDLLPTTLARLHHDSPQTASREGPQSPGSREATHNADSKKITHRDSLLFQHTILCQVYLPAQELDPSVLSLELRQGNRSLMIKAGEVNDGEKFINVGIPSGTAARLGLFQINRLAFQHGPVIDVERNITRFVTKVLHMDDSGRNIERVKNQLLRIAAADFKFGTIEDGRPHTFKTPIVDDFNVIQDFVLCADKKGKKKTLWPGTLQLSKKYFDDLMQHGVPLSANAIAKLKNNCLALDIYCWLAQRLWRVPAGPQGVLIPWQSPNAASGVGGLYEQFGQGYSRVRKFREKFISTLKKVYDEYPEAQLDPRETGLVLYRSPPPVERRERSAGQRRSRL